ITQGRCSSDVAVINVPAIIPMPKPAFTTTPPIPAKLGAPVTVKFQNKTTEADTYLWDFGDGSTSTEVNPEHTYTEKGDFTVKLTATKQDYCVASTLQGTLVVRLGMTAFVPNTFTPNADGVNDELVVTITNLNNYHINIYNRYGTKLFESRNIFDNWKGTYRNEPVPVGVYFYVIDGVNLDGEKVQKTGSLTVLR
ncbi:MAG: gliding motility-associated C-terminal domain-containing protein, partial [Mucilaginibacter polytrichastri]|nr:gliding motility-associated C-terminal domain-containing protein [Mucilaginibacter polytrichastri]